MSRRSTFRMAALCAGMLAIASGALALDDEAIGFERTPPRLSFIDGEVSFFRPGAEDWTPARVNTALAAGDELFTAKRANLELQIGSRAFARAGEDTQLGLTSLEPDYLQLRVTTGHLSLDLRSLRTGHSLELDTPNAAFRIERSGYYRVEVAGETTTFTGRRGGHATLTSASGDSVLIAASEQVIVRGTDAPQVESYAAPELDAWDRWNYARTDEQLDAVSARYVPTDVYGADDLDHYGDWRLLPSYGAVWVPRPVAIGWVPYSTGRWLYDPYYGWTWLDDAPWGWAPYHYGRWVRVSGFWGWCPGPSVRRAYYAPALVAFYGGGSSLGVTLGQPRVGWVALGYGEPLVPWWGPAHFRHRPRWAGWGGPRVVNHVVVQHDHVVHAGDLHTYQNAGERDAIVAVERTHFGRRSQPLEARFSRASADALEPLHGEVGVEPDRTSLVPEVGPAQRPPREAWQRSVVATREPRAARSPEFEARRAAWKSKTQPAALEDTARDAQDATLPEAPAPEELPRTRVVPASRGDEPAETSKRPPFGRHGEDLRRIPPPAPRFEGRKQSELEERAGGAPEPEALEPKLERASEASVTPLARPEWRRDSEAEPRPEWRRAPPQGAHPEDRSSPEPRGSQTSRGRRGQHGSADWRERREAASSSDPELPGEPANRVYRQPQGSKWPPKQRGSDREREGDR